MMAHSARDPYWQAGVRREVTDHPRAQAAIENECSRCHMPMAHVETQRRGGQQSVFANIPSASPAAAIDPLAVEGVSCALCHQITSDGLGSKASFTGGFVIETAPPRQGRQMFGPYEVEPGPRSVMRSATGLQPTASTHIQRSEVCATCHTLYTHALNASGEATSEFPEQMPYQEWLHSEFRDSQSCQSCHMPVVTEPMPIASVVGQPREGVSRHDFRGANFLMLGILNRFRAELGVVARPAELDAAVMRTKAFLQSSSANVAVESARVVGGRLEADVVVRNLAGHKLPTAYPSRRSWLRVTVRDGEGRLVFSSGDVEPTGAIAGNDNDRDAARFEPHYREIRSGDEVQIYEAIMGTATGQVTTGLLSAVTYLKDNRLPPRGFDKRTAPGDVAVHGDALADPDFGAGEDRVRYSVDTGRRSRAVHGRGPTVVPVHRLSLGAEPGRLHGGGAAAIRFLLRPGGSGVGADADARDTNSRVTARADPCREKVPCCSRNAVSGRWFTGSDSVEAPSSVWPPHCSTSMPRARPTARPPRPDRGRWLAQRC